MSRPADLYLDDILESARRIERYAGRMDEESSREDELVQDGVIRNLEVIGEVVKRPPDELRAAHPEIDWRKVAGLRDILIHEYAGVDLGIVWDIVRNRLPELKSAVRSMKSD